MVAGTSGLPHGPDQEAEDTQPRSSADGVNSDLSAEDEDSVEGFISIALKSDRHCSGGGGQAELRYLHYVEFGSWSELKQQFQRTPKYQDSRHYEQVYTKALSYLQRDFFHFHTQLPGREGERETFIEHE